MLNLFFKDWNSLRVQKEIVGGFVVIRGRNGKAIRKLSVQRTS